MFGVNPVSVVSSAEPPHSVRASAERLRPWAVLVFGLLLLLAFGLAGFTIAREHSLRVLGMWNGVSGTAAGIAAHRHHEQLARAAASAAALLAVLLGAVLLVPRRSEPALFRWLAWLALPVAGLLAAGTSLGLLGLSVHAALASFDPRCPLDGACHSAARAIEPAAWQATYFGLLGLAATSVVAGLLACIGIRWLIWAVRAVMRSVQSTHAA